MRGDDKPGITNLIEILAIVRGTAPAAIEHEFEGKGYGDFKTAVGEEVAAWLAPVRERYLELREDTAAIEAFLEEGAAKARAIAAQTVARRARRDGRRARPTPHLACRACGSPSWSWTSTSSRVRSTCCSR